MTVKDAVQQASKYLPEVFPSATGRELLLEGVEKTDDGGFWKITFSYEEPSKPATSAATVPHRVYKTVKLRDQDGEFFGAQNGYLLAAL